MIGVGVSHKLSALWVSVTLCYLYGDYFDLYVPGTADGLVSGENNLNSPVTLLAAATVLLIPALMVSLSLLLRPTANRRVNLIVGAFFTVFVAFVGVSSLQSWRAFYVLYAVVEVLLTLTIVWIAWRWPRPANDENARS
ncbi:MAG TPA: DUF6326 family protein [Pseudolysinimonas sp.]|jgi:hypothetical protein|nr:DUF6326 family protein [Pseudolysinimonas sp.]